jgi:hypothetical protein
MIKYNKRGKRTPIEDAMVKELNNLIEQTGDTTYLKRKYTQPYHLRDSIDALNKQLNVPPTPTEQPTETTQTKPTMEIEEAQVIEEKPTSSTNGTTSGNVPDDVPRNFDFSFEQNPLAEDLVERDYSMPEHDYDGSVPEFNTNEDKPKPNRIDATKPNTPGVAPDPSKDFKQAAEEIKSENAEKDFNLNNRKAEVEQTVDAALGVYEFLHTLGQKFGSIKEEEIQEGVMSGAINPNLTIPLDADGSQGNVLEYVHYHNEQIKQGIKYDPAFGEKVRPAMIREFAKRGLVMNDGYYLLAMFGQDIAQKFVILTQFKKQGNTIIDAFKNMSYQIKQQQEEDKKQAVNPDEITRPTTNQNNE